jgi:hypothetical protein
MPAYQEHIRQATHNDQLLERFKNQSMELEYSDWFVTISFYSAVHHFEAMLDRTGPMVKIDGAKIRVKHSDRIGDAYDSIRANPHHVLNPDLNPNPPHHQIRLKIMRENNLFDGVYAAFYGLYVTSRIARYHCHSPNALKWGLAETRLKTVKARCAAIK